MITDILIHVPAIDEPDPGVDFGLSVAKVFGAHATGVAFALEPMVPPAYFGAVPGEYIVKFSEDAEQAAVAAAARFKKRAEGESVKAEVRTARTTTDGAGDAFGRLARVFDLAVITQPNPDRVGPERLLLESALFESGRAVLAVPYVQKQPLTLDRVMIAWNGSRSATRAISEARPFLDRAKRVEVLVVETGKMAEGEIPGAELATHLARHKLKVDLRRVLVPAKRDIDEAILNEIHDSSIDLVVMGGYGHSRLREFVLGGVTRAIIESMTAPTLMAH
jgi:nucleotide-binding universal stress UspA family protein